MNRKRRYIFGIFTAAIAILAFQFMVFGQQVHASQKKTIRVGVSELEYISGKSETGERTGVLIDYLEEMIKYVDWDIEYVDCDLAESIEMMEAGEVDVLGGIVKDESTKAIFDFPEMNIDCIYNSVITKEERTEFISNDYDTLNGMKLGVYTKATKKNAELEEFCAANDITFEKVEYDDLEAFNLCLERNEVDGIYVVNTDLKPGQKIVARFAPRPYYFAVTKGKSWIVRDLNKAMEMMNTFQPDFSSQIYKKYFQADNNITDFSTKELEYIENSPVLKVVCLEQQRPYSYYDSKNKELRGIAVDILDNISKTTGFDFEYLKAESLEDAIAMLSSGKADIFCNSYQTGNLQETYRLLFSVPYINLQTVIISKDNVIINHENLEGKRAGVSYGFELTELFNSTEILRFNSIDKAIEAVKKGELDYAITSSLACDSYNRRHGLGNLHETFISSLHTEFSLAYPAKTSSLLISIIDKSIYSMNENDMQAIILKNAITDTPVSLGSYFYSNPGHMAGLITILAVISILVVFWIMRIRLKYSQKEAFLGESYRLLGDMANEYLFEYNYKTSELKLPEEFCVITGMPLVLRDVDSQSGAGLLFQYFNSGELKPSVLIDFECMLRSGETEWFRAICAIQFDEHGNPVRGLGKITSVQEEQLEKNFLKKQANTDSLTGLYLKGHCETLVNEYLQEVSSEQEMALIMIDLDNFKMVNDTIGHLGGDQVLKLLAGCIIEAPYGAISGRFGGDEFFLFVKEIISLDALHRGLEDLCEYMNQDFKYGEKSCPISISIGAACSRGGKLGYVELLEAADRALYETKNKGRNGFTIVEI